VKTPDQSLLKQDLLRIREDIVCGFHSGFPPCCIKFFVTKWLWMGNTKARKDHWKKIRRVRCFDVEYIPCPECLKNKTFVKLKKCPKTCAKLKRVKAWIKKEKKNAAKSKRIK